MTQDSSCCCAAGPAPSCGCRPLSPRLTRWNRCRLYHRMHQAMPPMPNEVDFAADPPFDVLGLDRWMPALADEVLRSEGIDDGSVSLFITDDETVQALNRDYRGYDQPTDVLSFGLSELAKPATDDQEPEPATFVLPPDSGRQ